MIFAGEGARSTLHRDPFEWTGLSLCLEGSKVWRFVSAERDGIAAVDGLLGAYRLVSETWGSISAGWQSDESLFKTRREDVPSARTLANMADADRRRAIDDVAQSDTALEASLNGLVCETLVQHAGDVVVIPRGYYHQTYALEASVAVASQRCGLHDAHTVVNHILETTDNTKLLHLLDFQQGPRVVVPALFEHLKNKGEPQLRSSQSSMTTKNKSSRR